MISTRTLRDWFVILLLLLFLPKENKLTMIDMKPEDWYGETYIPAGDDLVIIGKNSSTEKVDLSLEGEMSAVALQSGQYEGITLHRAEALPESITIIRTERKSNDVRDRNIFMDDKYYFQPGSLSILTQADFYYGYLLVGLLMGGFMLLGFLIARHGADEDIVASQDMSKE